MGKCLLAKTKKKKTIEMKIGYITFLFLILLSACNSAKKQSELANITSALDSLKSIYAPDERVALWNIIIEANSQGINISGELDNKIAISEIEKVVRDKYPDVSVKLKALPEDNKGRTVNGLVNNSVINLRANPRHSAEIVTQLLLGTPVKILKKENGWYLVQAPNKYIAWVDAPALVKKNSDEIGNYQHSKKVIFNKQYGFSYAEPDDKSQVVSDLVIGSILPVLRSNTSYYQVQYPDKRMAWVKKDDVLDANEVFNKQPDGEALVETAVKFLGIPYLWGGTSSKAVDCSGLTSTIYFLNGVVLQRDASQQIKYGEVVSTVYDGNALQPGDLLFFRRGNKSTNPEIITHVAMYIGNSEFIHASGRVKINSIDSTSENFIPEYVTRFVCALRIKNNTDGLGLEPIPENEFYKEIISNKK